MRRCRALGWLFVAVILGSCAANIKSSHKADGYSDRLGAVDVFIVDFGPTSESYLSGNMHSQGNRSQSDMSRRMQSSASQLMAAFQSTLPVLLTENGLQPTLSVIQKSQNRLSVTEPNRKALLIRMTQIKTTCSSGGCVTRVSLKTEIIDPALQKTVWTAEADVAETTIFDKMDAENVKAYWKLIYGRMKQDGLVA